MGSLTPEHGSPRSVTLAVVAAFLMTLALQAGYAFLLELPVPEVHDEFAYLLAGDTFASGRLTNPTHPHWKFFDTLHVLQQPSYQAKYPPGQGLFLALGQVLGGQPAIGVWISMALACAAAAWMLSALVPAGWACAGPLLFFAHPPVLQHWGASYWGGGVAFLGGALFLGGLAHLRRGPSTLHASLAGLGGLLLVNSRPLEGAFLALLTAPIWFVEARGWVAAGKARLALRRVALPLLLALALTLLWAAIYNHAVTGDALQLPYTTWDKYASPREDIQHYAGSAERSFLGKMRYMQQFFSGPTLVYTLPFLLLRVRSRTVQWAAVAVAVSGLASALSTRAWSHYLAPLTPLTILLQVEALRGLASIWFGRWVVVLFVAAHLFLSGQVHSNAIRNGPLDVWYQERRRVLEELEEEPGEHLVFVRYSPRHNIHREWVYNAADIDAARIVWAHDEGIAENRTLIDHYPARSVWLVEADVKDPEARTYPPDSSSTSSDEDS